MKKMRAFPVIKTEKFSEMGFPRGILRNWIKIKKELLTIKKMRNNIIVANEY